MKIETWYDIGCSICGRHWSTDFGHNFENYKKGLSARARKEGWKFKEGKNICPICAEEKLVEEIKSNIKELYEGMEK